MWCLATSATSNTGKHQTRQLTSAISSMGNSCDVLFITHGFFVLAHVFVRNTRVVTQHILIRRAAVVTNTLCISRTKRSTHRKVFTSYVQARIQPYEERSREIQGPDWIAFLVKRLYLRWLLKLKLHFSSFCYLSQCQERERERERESERERERGRGGGREGGREGDRQTELSLSPWLSWTH